MKKQYKQPRLAEMIAGDLRARILDGELADGEMLPRQEELLATFNVSPPSLRGALQILETEGLITVLRGSVGGAVVHTPKARGVAYNVGLVLQSNKVGLQDIALSLEHLEPLCVRLCALRDDRSTEVLPYLWALHREIEENLEDFELVTRTARAFHEELVARCGNETLILVAGALETIWSAHERVWVDTMAETGAAPTLDEQRAYLAVHEQIITAIEAGDADEAARLATEHLQGSERPLIAPTDALVDASLVQSPWVSDDDGHGPRG